MKSKYYPWILFALFSLFFGIQLDGLAGLIVGFISSKGLLRRLEVSPGLAKKLEQKFPFKRYASKPGNDTA